MGYTIKIGELKVETHEDGLDCDCITFDVELQRFDDAPAFGEPTDFENQRWPSYTAWSNALQDVGLYDAFFHDNGSLIGGHPGVRYISDELMEFVSNAKEKFEKENPDIKADYKTGNLAASYCRMVWLHFWMQWAKQNCKTPVIVNS